MPKKKNGLDLLDERFAWNARVARWRHAMLAALAEGRTNVKWVLPLYREDPAVPLADVVGGWRETWQSEGYQGTHVLRLDDIGNLEAVPRTQGRARGSGKARAVADPLEQLAAHAPLFAPNCWSGKSKAARFAKKVTASDAWRMEDAHYSNWESGHAFLSTMPDSLRGDPDFIGPFLLCHGLVALAFAAPEVQRDPDILRAVFSESWTGEGDAGSGIVDSLFDCLRDRSSGLSGPASMPAGTSRRFENDGREIWVYCLAQEASGAKGKRREMVSSLLVWCPDGEDIPFDEELDIAAVRIRSRLNASGKTADWERVEYTLRSPLNNCLAEESRLSFFMPEEDDEEEDEFEFVDEGEEDLEGQDAGAVAAPTAVSAVAAAANKRKSKAVAAGDWRAVLEEALGTLDPELARDGSPTMLAAFQELAYLIWRGLSDQAYADEELAILRWAERDSSVNDILNNPGVPASLLAASAADVDPSVRERVAQNPSTPVPVLLALANDKEEAVRRAVARNEAVPIDVLVGLAQDRQPWVRSEAASHPSLPAATRNLMANDKHPDVRKYVAAAPTTPAQILQSLARDAKVEVREAAAANPATPVTSLQALSKDASDDVRCGVAENPAAPVAVLRELARDAETVVRSRVASNPATPSTLLMSLAQDEDEGVRTCVAKNPHTPVSVLEELLDTDGDAVYKGVGWNPAKPMRLLERLDSTTREVAAQNPEVPIGVLKALAKDEWENVRAVVAEHPATPPSLLKLLAQDSDDLVRCGVARNRATPGSVLRDLSSEEDRDVCWAVASNPSTPGAVLRAMSKDSDDYELLRIAENPSAPASVLEELARAFHPAVRKAVAENSSTPPAALEWLALCPHHNHQAEIDSESDTGNQRREKRTRLLKQVCSASSPSYLRALALRLPDAPPDALTKCAKSPLWVERCVVAQHSATPEKVRAQLVDDADPMVSAAARWRQQAR